MHPDDALSRVDRVKRKVTGAVTIRRIINVSLFFISFALLGMMNWAEFTFDLEKIKSPSLWFETALKVLAVSILYISLSSSKVEALVTKDTQYLAKRSTSEKIATASRPDQATDYLLGYNRKIKKETFRENVGLALRKLERGTLLSRLIPGHSARKQRAWAKYQQWHKTNHDEGELESNWSSYVLTKIKLLKMQRTDWIEEHIDEIYVRYDVTYYHELTSGIKSSGYGKSPLKANGWKHQFSHVFKVMLNTFLLTGVMRGLVVDFMGAEILFEPILQTALTMFTLLWSAISAYYDGKIIFDTVEFPKIAFKESVLKGYVNWERDINKYNIWFDMQGNIHSDAEKNRNIILQKEQSNN